MNDQNPNVKNVTGVGPDASRRTEQSSDEPACADDPQKDVPEQVGQHSSAPSNLTEDAVLEELKKVIDPELFVNIVDLGLIYEIAFEPSEEESDDGKTNVKIDMTMTSPACPAGPQLIAQSKMVVKQMSGVADAEVRIVMDPPWTPDKMTDDARDQLGIF